MRRHIGFTSIILTFFFCSMGRAQVPMPAKKMSGDVTLLSHFVENGISQSDNSPALQSSAWFSFGSQFRMGLTGSNVNYKIGDDHFRLKINAEIKVIFSSVSNMNIFYSQNQYFKSSEHNGTNSGIRLNFPEFIVTYKQSSNWQGTKKSAGRYGFTVPVHLINSWESEIEAAYNTTGLSSVHPYADIRAELGKKVNSVFLSGEVTATTGASELAGTGDVFFILSAMTEF